MQETHKCMDVPIEGEKPLEGEIQQYVEERNRNAILLVNIESVYAIENLDSILSVPDLDGILIGPHDLSCSLEIPEQYDHPRFFEALKTIVTKTREKGLIAAAHFINCGPIEMAMEWINTGVNMMIMDTDLIHVTKSIRKDLSYLQKEPGESDLDSDTESIASEKIP